MIRNNLLSAALGIACLLASFTARASVLPTVDGTTVIAEWGGTITFWDTNNTTNPFPPKSSYATSYGDFTITPTLRDSGGDAALLMPRTGNVYTLEAQNLTYGPIGSFTIQLSKGSNTTYDSISQLTLSIGGQSFGIADAVKETVSLAEWNEDRYAGYFFAGVHLENYTWDLSSLAPDADFSEFTITWAHGGMVPTLADVQIAVAPIPEPSTWAMLGIASGLTLFGIRRNRRKATLHA